MFVIDFIAAAILALVLTIAFTETARRAGFPRMGRMSAPIWLMSISSWVGGILLLVFGPPLTGTHWLPFAVAGLLAGFLVLILPGFPRFGQGANGSGQRSHEARTTIAMYFIVTLLLFSCAISVRFYIVHLA